MEEEKAEVVFTARARKSISNISMYIEEEGYHETAEKFAEKLFDFGNSLGIFPEKYPICRHEPYAKRKYRCVTFKKYYVFVHKLVKDQLIIYNVIHGKRLG